MANVSAEDLPPGVLEYFRRGISDIRTCKAANARKRAIRLGLLEACVSVGGNRSTVTYTSYHLTPKGEEILRQIDP